MKKRVVTLTAVIDGRVYAVGSDDLPAMTMERALDFLLAQIKEKLPSEKRPVPGAD